MNENSRNLFLAAALSLAVVFLWQAFVIEPRIEAQRQAEALRTGERPGADPALPRADGASTGLPGAASGTAPGTVAPAGAPAPGSAQSVPGATPAAAPVETAARVEIATPALEGSITTLGARIDDLRLKGYRESVDPASPLIRLLHRSGTAQPYFAEFGYSPDPALGDLPGPRTAWRQVEGGALAPGAPVVLETDNGSGLTFRRTIALDDAYMFTVTDTVANGGAAPVALRPYGRVVRHGQPDVTGIYVLHEGLIGSVGERGLDEIGYGDLDDDRLVQTERAASGWMGITDKYWATALVPGVPFVASYRRYGEDAAPIYQADYLADPINVPAGGEASVTTRLFAGAKKVSVVEAYEEALSIPLFSNLIDWGWLYFLTKPLFYLMEAIAAVVGNWGVAILLVTVLVKLVFFPLANKSYVSMARMKTVQPEMMRIREQHGDDRQAQQKEMMELYKREKINPAAGCWPVLIQIPVFFALYKVIYVSLELRHAPFFGWIQDLSAPDPTSIINLFGLLPFDSPPALAIIAIGVWPLIMGITMFVQMQMNPAPPDPTQAMIFKWMPVVFTFMLATFPAGLVIYWAWNNTLSVLQQGFIMKRQGAKIELWDNLKGLFSRKDASA